MSRPPAVIAATPRVDVPRAVVLLVAACLAAVGLIAVSDAPAKADASTLYTLVNQSRQSAGLPALARDSRLDAVAQAWTKKMASSGTLSHNPSYSSQIPSGWTRAGENVGYDYSDANLHSAWMNSAGHKANILGSYTSVGIGYVRDSSGRIWGTQVFASYPGVKPPVAPVRAASNTITDLTRDVKTDMVGVDGSGSLVIVPGTGAGTLRSGITLGGGWGGMRNLIPVSDSTRDGLADLYARDGAGALWLYRGASAGGFASRQQVGSGWNGMTAMLDLDGNRDGSTDLYARDASGRLFFYPSNGAGGFGRAVQVGKGWNAMTAIVSPGDVTRDRVADVFARDASGAMWLYPGNGAGGFLARTKVGFGWNGLTVVAPGDLTGDGVGDVVARTSSGQLYLYAGNGRGGFLGRSALGSSWAGLTKLG